METCALVLTRAAADFQARGLVLNKRNNVPHCYTVIFPDGTLHGRGTTSRGYTMHVYLTPAGAHFILRDPEKGRPYRTLELIDNDDFLYFFDHPASGLPKDFKVNVPA